jgi:hypothetical protein
MSRTTEYALLRELTQKSPTRIKPRRGVWEWERQRLDGCCSIGAGVDQGPEKLIGFLD